MEAGLESVSPLAMTFLRHPPNVSLVAGLSAFTSDWTRRERRNLDISKLLLLLQAISDSTVVVRWQAIPTVSACTYGA